MDSYKDLKQNYDKLLEQQGELYRKLRIFSKEYKKDLIKLKIKHIQEQNAFLGKSFITEAESIILPNLDNKRD